MAHDTIQVQYEVLEQVAGRFGRLAEEKIALQQLLQQRTEPLRNGGWVGRGSQAYYAEMDREVLPAVRRLIGAFEQADQDTRALIELFASAEEQAAAAFVIDGGVGDRIGPPGWDERFPTIPPDIGYPLPPEMTDDDRAHDLFRPDEMKKMMDWPREPIVDQERMANGMRALLKLVGRGFDDLDSVRKVLQHMASAYVPPKDMAYMEAMYTEFIGKYREVYGNGGPDLELLGQPDFYASTVQLRFGKVVGDALGLDPVFGALLSPTGGGAGWGGKAICFRSNSALGLHSVFHDAGGFLYTRFGLGPGYTYAPPPLPYHDFARRLPWSGQAEGLAFWTSITAPSLVIPIIAPVTRPPIPGLIDRITRIV